MNKSDYMKKYFLFDNEILSGNNYLIRVILGTLAIALLGLGLWVLAASWASRGMFFSGAFKLSAYKYGPYHIVPQIAFRINLKPFINSNSTEDNYF